MNKEIIKELVEAIKSNIEIMKEGSDNGKWVDAIKLQYIADELEEVENELKK